MAHLQGFKKVGLGNILAHVSRHKDARGDYIRFGNQNIDPARTPENYNLGPRRTRSQMGYVNAVLSKFEINPRKNQNIIGSFVVTLPRDVPAEREREFFKSVYSFLVSEIGDEALVVSAFVHRDETTPHIHFCFMPLQVTSKTKVDKSSPMLDPETGAPKKDKAGALVYERTETGEKRVSLSLAKMYSRERLAGFHERLDSFLEASMGFKTGVLLPEGDPQRALSFVPKAELDKARRALEAEAKAAHREAERAKAETATMRAERSELTAEVAELREEKRHLAADLGEFLDAVLHGGFGWEAVAARLVVLARRGNSIAAAFVRAFDKTGDITQGQNAAVERVKEQAHVDRGRSR